MKFSLSPVVRITLLTLYGALTIPLPFLAKITQASISSNVLWTALALGLIGLWGILSEQVVITEETIGVQYPLWIKPFLPGWEISWSDVTALKPRTTGQGGLVYYLVTSHNKAYLLPMRIAGFTKLVTIVQEKTGIDTRDVHPLSQPWMYFLLFGFTVILLLIDGILLRSV